MELHRGVGDVVGNCYTMIRKLFVCVHHQILTGYVYVKLKMILMIADY